MIKSPLWLIHKSLGSVESAFGCGFFEHETFSSNTSTSSGASMSAENVRRFGAPAATYGAAFENPVSLSLLGGRSSGSAGGGGHFSATQ